MCTYRLLFCFILGTLGFEGLQEGGRLLLLVEVWIYECLKTFLSSSSHFYLPPPSTNLPLHLQNSFNIFIMPSHRALY